MALFSNAIYFFRGDVSPPPDVSPIWLRTQQLRTSTSKTQEWTTQEWTKPSAATLGVECQSSSTSPVDSIGKMYGKLQVFQARRLIFKMMWHLSVLVPGWIPGPFFHNLAASAWFHPSRWLGCRFMYVKLQISETIQIQAPLIGKSSKWSESATKKCTYVIMFIHTFTKMLLSTLLLVRKVHFLEYLWMEPSVPNPHLSGSWPLGWSNTMLRLHGSGFQGCSLACKLHGLASHQGFGPTPEWKPPQL